VVCSPTPVNALGVLWCRLNNHFFYMSSRRRKIQKKISKEFAQYINSLSLRKRIDIAIKILFRKMNAY